MTKEIAETLIAGQKIKYWDDRIATVIQAAAAPVPMPPPLVSDPTPVITISFDAEPDPKPTCVIKSNDFMRAEST